MYPVCMTGAVTPLVPVVPFHFVSNEPEFLISF